MKVPGWCGPMSGPELIHAVVRLVEEKIITSYEARTILDLTPQPGTLTPSGADDYHCPGCGSTVTGEQLKARGITP